MYERLIGKKVKIVHEDGSHIIVSYGKVKEYDSEIKTILIMNDEGNSIYINAKNIQKLEVLSSGD